jgi:hypothetical protein
MDALSPAVSMKVNCDLQLTLMASSLYRLLACRIGRGYEQAKSRHLFRDFVDATATVTVTGAEVQVRYHKRAQPVAHRGRSRRDRLDDPLAGRGTPATGLRVASSAPNVNSEIERGNPG